METLSMLEKLKIGDSKAGPTIVSARHRLIVGVDYGTTYSGVSYVTSDKTSIDDINVIRTWPGRDGEWKTPTRIAYAYENAKVKLTQDAWGYQVEPNMTSCSWTKLLLDHGAKVTKHDDPKLSKAVDEGMLRIPDSKTAQIVCEDFLREVYKHMVARLTRQLSAEVLESTPMDCWLTVPAVWSDQAQDATKKAAQAAGFGSRPSDSISVITEPEAAAIATLKKYLQPGAINPPQTGEAILICDCGGGTVDITTYEIVGTSPTLEFEELCVGIGGKCGATFIDRNLYDLMSQRFGQAFEEVEMRRKGPGSRFMNAFESVKRSFGTPGDDRVQEIGPLIMKGVDSSDWYDDDEGMVRLTREDVESLFTPVVDEVIKLVHTQAYAVQQEGHQIDRLILIGGFGDSEYLYAKLKEWCASSGGTKPFCPEHPQAAIVRGAALRGLMGTKPRRKKCRKHYGVVYRQAFREGIDPEWRSSYHEWSGAKLCDGRMHWMITKGQTINKDTRCSVKLALSRKKTDTLVSNMQLLCCDLEKPPEYSDHPSIEKVGVTRTDFTAVDKSKFESRRTDGPFSKKMWNFTFDLEVQFGAESGLLEFRSSVLGKESGVASIAFD